jgi:hypothetical protein
MDGEHGFDGQQIWLHAGSQELHPLSMGGRGSGKGCLPTGADAPRLPRVWDHALVPDHYLPHPGSGGRASGAETRRKPVRYLGRRHPCRDVARM